jgi:hypothetical protein
LFGRESGFDPSWTLAGTERIRKALGDIQIFKIDEAIKACMSWQWSVDDVEAHIAYWKNSGKPREFLANWLTKEGSAPARVLRDRAQAVRNAKEREDALAATRARVRAEGNGASDWYVSAITVARFEKENLGWWADAEDYRCVALLKRVVELQALAKQKQDTALGGQAKRLLFNVGDMPSDEVELEIEKLEASAATELQHEGSPL